MGVLGGREFYDEGMHLPEQQPSDSQRIGDTERNQAMAWLSEMTGTGHLDLAEFEERSRLIAEARTRNQLDEVMADLPEPHETTGEIAPVETMQDQRKVAAIALSSVGVVFIAAILALPWLLILVPVITLGAWLSGKGPSNFYRN
ncbi:DUF1707 SHOCT-like domain-containing protein [Corynebacterium sp. A21]|uniref:DUF1707 SHOCT-like domain-containing protein n=1 Tax=Corynebacterium sp. A21 TaxID=3457318 RepID=UPI003FCF6D0E